MSGEQLFQELQSLERKIQGIIHENKRLKEDLRRLREEKGHLEAKINDQKKYIERFKNQMEVNKFANNMRVGIEDANVLKDKIDGCIKEIDRCIAHLTE